MSISLDPLALVSLVCAVNLIYVGVFSWLEGASLLTGRLFGALCFTAAWWAGCLGLAFSELGIAWPELLQLSQLLSGLFGPLTLLYVASQSGLCKSLRGPWALALIPGFAGTLSILLILIIQPPEYHAVSVSFIQGSSAFDVNQIAAEHPWYNVLQRIHGIQLLLYTLAAIVVAGWAAKTGTVRRDRVESGFNAVLFTIMLIGIILTNVLPGLGYPAWLPRLAPILPLPFILTLWRFLRRRIDTAEALTKQREVLLTYLPSKSIDKLLQEGNSSNARKVEAAVLFTDLRGFTKTSERADPVELVAWIDVFFSRMTRIILDELGMVDKLIGDAVLAVFGVPEWLDKPCDRAVIAAQRMQADLAQLNQERPLDPDTPMQMGIGIHYGPLVAGTVGSDARRTYTVFGDTVNTASRIESLTKEFQRKLLISSAVLEKIDAPMQKEFEEVGETEIRGRSQTVSLYGWRQS